MNLEDLLIAETEEGLKNWSEPFYFCCTFDSVVCLVFVKWFCFMVNLYYFLTSNDAVVWYIVQLLE